jgi:hypothetical protein
MNRHGAEQLWFRSAIVFGAALFILALFVSAVFDPSIRVLHALQALIYVAVVILTLRNSPWGYGAGVVVAAFWNYINLFVTTFIRSGLVQLIGLLQTGRITRPDQFLAIIAATGHCVLIVACLTGFLETRPKAVGSPILATSCPPPGSAQSYAGRHAHERILRPSRIS